MNLSSLGAAGAVGLLYAEESGIPLPIPGDVWVLYFASRLPSRGWAWFIAWIVLIACVTLGASNLYLVSRRFGGRLIGGRLGQFFHVTPQRIERAELWFERYGFWAQVFGRHVPGCRVPLTVVAGTLRVPYPRFAAAVVVSTAIWTGVLMSGAALAGPGIAHLIASVSLPVLAGAAAIIGLVFLTATLLWQGRGQPGIFLAAILVTATLASCIPAQAAADLGGPYVNATEQVDTRATLRIGHTGAPPQPLNVYAATLNGAVSPAVAGIPARVYVPNSVGNTLTVIDPGTLAVVGRIPVSLIPHHVTPAPGFQRLYVNNEGASSLTVIDPRTGQARGSIAVPYPYNLYFTPDGRKAVVVVERLHRIDFRDPEDWHLLGSADIPWLGVDHLDFTADGRHLLASTEWSGRVVRVDTETMQVDGVLEVGGLPIDVRLAPAGDVFFVTNQGRQGVSVVDPEAMREVDFIPTGFGAHGLQLSRDTTRLYVTNRLAGTISVVDVAERKVTTTWTAGGGPDMTQLNPDGTQLWVANRFDGSVSVIDTRNGSLIARIPTGAGAHGLSYFPNAGLVSLGHNGVYR